MPISEGFEHLTDEEMMWPEGSQRREQVRGHEDRALASSSFAWHSNGNIKHSESIVKGKAELRRCLGVFKCNSCSQVARPNTKTFRDQFDTGCPDPCNSPYIWMQCEAKTFRFVSERGGMQYSVWEHSGSHQSHPRPPGGRLSLGQREAVKQQVMRHHDASSYQLRTGDLGPGSVPLAKISPSLANARSARYAVEKSCESLGINPRTQKGGGSLLRGFSELSRELSTPFLLDSSLSGPVFILLGTPFMSLLMKEAVDDWITDAKEGPSVGRHGLVTDVDHSYFRQGNLLAPCAWSHVMEAWVPVLFCWVDRLNAEHHRPHFRRLFNDIVEHSGTKFDKKFLTHVCSRLRSRA